MLFSCWHCLISPFKRAWGKISPITVLRPGDVQNVYPVTIAIIANPAIERPWKSGQYVVDPIIADRSEFDGAASNINKSLFGEFATQKEKLLGSAPGAVKIKVISFFLDTLPINSANALVAEDDSRKSDILIPRREALTKFFHDNKFRADVLLMVSKSPTHTRASAYGTTGDPLRSSVGYTLDGVSGRHYGYVAIPGSAAIHVTKAKEGSLTAVHEFSHAISDYKAFITDLYVDGTAAFNRKVGRPIPDTFATYNGERFVSDKLRDGLGYPTNWNSYHAELQNTRVPAVMDAYPNSSEPLTCEHDRITKRLILDVVAAKIGRTRNDTA